MPAVSAQFKGDARVEVRNDGPLQEDAGCVLLWIQRAQRALANPAIDAAIDLARERHLPVIAVFCMVPSFPAATLRTYRFMAEGLLELPEALARRGIGWILEVGEPGHVLPRLVKRFCAAAVVTDLNPLRIGQAWRGDVAQAIDVPLLIVDADTVVPSALFQKEEYAARTIRPKILKALDSYLQPGREASAPVASDVREGPDPLSAVDDLELDRSVGPAPDFTGGAEEAHRRLRDFVTHRLDRYDEERNRADIDAGSQLSPYLHFGQISPATVALAIRDAHAPAAAKDSYIGELIVQRELSINFALRNPRYDQFAGLPDWARESLARHAADPREHHYTRSEFEGCDTHDPLWNAAMTQMIHEGWLPNRLRMYWGKQIALWSESVEAAFRTAVDLNDRYFLDGRDANSYGNIGWCIGGRHDRPFGPERPVTGLVRPMGMGAMKRTFDVNAYLDKVSTRWPAQATKE